MKQSSRILIFILGLCVLALLIPSVKTRVAGKFYDATAGAGSFFYKIGHHLNRDFQVFTSIHNIVKQNDILTDKLTELEVDKSQIAELQNENKILTTELGFLSSADTSTLIPAKIIERDPISFADFMIIDKGSADGVALNQPILSNGVLVGQISEISDHTSKILLITGRDSLVQAMLQTSRAKGIMRGGISGLVLDNIVSDTTYTVGENIVTSGLGGKIKEGILIGQAGKITSSQSEIYKSIEVVPLIDLSKLEVVFVEKP